MLGGKSLGKCISEGCRAVLQISIFFIEIICHNFTKVKYFKNCTRNSPYTNTSSAYFEVENSEVRQFPGSANQFDAPIQYVDFDKQQISSVYRKPTHTDQYLAYDSHHPQSVKRGIVKCLYDRAKRLVTKPSVIAGEKKHPSSVLVSNGYPSSFVQRITKARTTPR